MYHSPLQLCFLLWQVPQWVSSQPRGVSGPCSWLFMCLHPTGVILNHPILTVTTLGVLKQRTNEGCEYSRENGVLPIPDISISSSWAEVTEELEFQMQRHLDPVLPTRHFKNKKDGEIMDWCYISVVVYWDRLWFIVVIYYVAWQFNHICFPFIRCPTASRKQKTSQLRCRCLLVCNWYKFPAFLAA